MKTKVLHVCAVDFTVKNFLRPLLRFLMEQGFDVVTACSPGPFVAQLRQEGFDLREIPIARSHNLLSHLRSTRRLYRLMRAEGFTIVHVHTPVASLIGRLAAHLARVPIVIYTAHGFYFHDQMPAAKRRFHVTLEKIGARWCDFLFTQSDEDRQTAIRERIFPSDRVLTIGNGVDLARFNPAHVDQRDLENIRRDLGLASDALVVGVVGRLVQEKGYFELFEAAAHLRSKFANLKVLVIGDALGSDYDNSKLELEAFIARLGVRDNIVFAGMRDDVERLLALVDIFCLPSYREGMPRSIIEAMAMGKPVVATNIRGCREEVVDEETGFLVAARESRLLASALEKLLRDPELRKRCGEAGRQRALALFDERNVLQRQLTMYDQLLREKHLTRERIPSG
jgi:glycosyltransferase involved in cell wall biosynthesis